MSQKQKRKNNLKKKIYWWPGRLLRSLRCFVRSDALFFPEQYDTQALMAYCRFCLCLCFTYHKLHFGQINTYCWCSRWPLMQCIYFLISVNWPFILHLLVWLPAGHTLLPDHRWGSPVGGWPAGTPSLPLWCHTQIQTHESVYLQKLFTL